MKNSTRLSLVLLLLFALAASVPGAVISLENGDRVTGDVIRTEGEELIVKTTLMGEVKIAWKAVVSVESDTKLYVSSQEGQVLVGPVTTEADELAIQTENSGRVAIPKAQVAYVRNQEAQEAYDAEIERLRNPALTDFWRGFLDTNLALTTGNAETTSFANAAGMTRETKRDTIKIYFNSIYARQSTTGEPLATANAIRGGTRYELNVTDRLFTFGFVDLEYDQFQDLDLRNVLGGGLGYKVKDTDRISFDLFGGVTYNQEFFANNLTRRSAEVILGEDLEFELNDRTSLTERLAFYPNMSNTGEYRLQFDTAIVTDVFKWMAWNITFSDRFISNPAPGRQKNDVFLTTGVRLVFGSEKLH